MKISDFRAIADLHMDALLVLFEERMPYRGDTESESQRMVLMHRWHALEHAVNGVSMEDMEPQGRR